MVIKNFLFFLGFILVLNMGLTSAEDFGYNLLTQPTFNNNTAFVNSSAFWVTTSLGPLSDANSSDFTGTSGQLNIIDKWVDTSGDTMTGNLGIGTATPQSLLNINGTPSFSDLSVGLTFGDGDTGFNEVADDTLGVWFGGVRLWQFQSSVLRGVSAGNPSILNEVSTLTNPIYTVFGDLDTGLGMDGSDSLALITGGVSGLTIDSSQNVTIPGIGKIGNITIEDNEITSSTGVIDFGNENLTTTELGTFGTLTTTALATLASAKIGSISISSNDITDTTGTIQFGSTNLETIGDITAREVKIGQWVSAGWGEFSHNAMFNSATSYGLLQHSSGTITILNSGGTTILGVNGVSEIQVASNKMTLVGPSSSPVLAWGVGGLLKFQVADILIEQDLQVDKDIHQLADNKKFFQGASNDYSQFFNSTGKFVNLEVGLVSQFFNGWTSTTFDHDVFADNIFLPQYIFPHTNETISLVSANVWANITFSQEETDLKIGIEHDAVSLNHTFNITEDGVYEIHFNLDIIDTSVGASDIDVAGRLIYNNGTEIIGSVFEVDIIKQEIEGELSHVFLANFLNGDVVVFQFVATDVDVELSTHGNFGIHPDSATIIIKKVANI